MLTSNEILEFVRQALAEVLGLREDEITLDTHLQDDLGLEPDDVEDIAAHLQSALEIHIAPDELFPDDELEEMTVQSVVNALEDRVGRG